jgi:hypothetical protein
MEAHDHDDRHDAGTLTLKVPSTLTLDAVNFVSAVRMRTWKWYDSGGTECA